MSNIIIGSHDPQKAPELHVRRLTIQEAKHRKVLMKKATKHTVQSPDASMHESSAPIVKKNGRKDRKEAERVPLKPSGRRISKSHLKGTFPET